MTPVVVTADVPRTGSITSTTAVRLPPVAPSSAATKEQVIDIIREQAEAGGGTVICVYPSWRAQPAERTVRLARTALAPARIVSVPSSLPPLALSLAVDLLAHLGRYVPPGILVAMLPRLEQMVLSGAWVRSATRLQHIPTTMGHHLRSYLPGASFVATAAPQQGLVSTHAFQPSQVARPHEPIHLLVSPHGGGTDDWVRANLVPALRPSVVRSLPPQPLGEGYWGNKKHVEFLAYSGHADVLTRAVRSIRYRPCSWCGELVSADPCPFCYMSARGAAFRPSQTLPEGHQPPPENPLLTPASSGSARPSHT
ncbi:MAG: hypothetical protein GEV10_15085 [Streptosporangiales bacterium]|nr:hypothetical protein [Streptosporangiales bacterium]